MMYPQNPQKFVPLENYYPYGSYFIIKSIEWGLCSELLKGKIRPQ